MKTKEPGNSGQHAWNAISILAYAVLTALLGYGIYRTGQDIEALKTRELLLLMLATYRLTRIIVFEKIFKFFRDFVKTRSVNPLFNTLRAIITCPWCAGVWVALFILAFYFLVPYGRLFILLLALAGVATFIILLSNILGLKIEKDQGSLKGSQGEE
jgi:hypothetical protein